MVPPRITDASKRVGLALGRVGSRPGVRASARSRLEARSGTPAVKTSVSARKGLVIAPSLKAATGCKRVNASRSPNAAPTAFPRKGPDGTRVSGPPPGACCAAFRGRGKVELDDPRYLI